MSTNIATAPVFGTDYDIGTIFFTSRPSVVSCGIRWFSRDDVPVDFVPSHVGVVTGENECYESLAHGTVKSDMQKYFTDPKVQIVFRYPRQWTPEMGQRIKSSAERISLSKKGKPAPYGYGLIAGHALAQSMVGRVFAVLSMGWSSKLLLRIADRKASMVCSEFVAEVAKDQKELAGRSVLKLPSYEIRPLSLLTDPQLWKQC